MLSIESANLARSWIAAPGSTLKPFSLLALLEANKLTSRDEYVCPGKLVLNGRSLNCSHPPTPLPMNVARAIAYSCNCAVAYFAERFAPDELSNFLGSRGFVVGDRPAVGDGSFGRGAKWSHSRIVPTASVGRRRRQGHAFGVIACLPPALPDRVAEPAFAPILEGLEGAVDFGTAQGARLKRVRVAGKTGSVQAAPGVHAAWFAGFAPSRGPEVVVTVLVQGRSGGADAAPLAGKILREYFAEKA